MTDPTGKISKSHHDFELRLLAYAAVPALAIAGPGTAKATTILNFTGPYDVSNWTQSVGGTGSINTSGAPNSVTLNGSNGGTNTPVNVDFTISAVGTGTVAFSWTWFNSDISSSYDLGQWLLNGTPNTLTGVLGSASGASSFAVNAGDTIGFRVEAVDDQFGPASLTIQDFSAPSRVPEPSSLSLMALGAAGLFLARRRRKKA